MTSCVASSAAILRKLRRSPVLGLARCNGRKAARSHRHEVPRSRENDGTLTGPSVISPEVFSVAAGVSTLRRSVRTGRARHSRA